MFDVLNLYRRQPFLLAWFCVALLVLAAAGLRHITGLEFHEAATPIGGSVMIGLVALAYGISGRSVILSNMAHWAMLWIIFSLSAGIISYAVVALGGPTYDAEFAALDAALGFSWPKWYDFVTGYPALRFALAVAYTTLLPQILFAILYFGLTNQNHRNREFFSAVVIAFAITIVISWRFPALGALPYFGHADEAQRFYFDDFRSLRSHRGHDYSLMKLKGLITLPSFHTVLAILFTYVQRGPGLLPRFIAIVNACVLVSIPVGGGHYLSDMIAGGGVAIVTIMAVRLLEGYGAAKQIRREKETLATTGELGSS